MFKSYSDIYININNIILPKFVSSLKTQGQIMEANRRRGDRKCVNDSLQEKMKELTWHGISVILTSCVS